MNDNIQPDDTALPLAAQLFDRLALGADGQPFDDGDPETWGAADAAEPVVVFLGPARFAVVDADAIDLAVAAGAIEPGELPMFCMRVAFEQAEGAPVACVGQYLSVATDEPGVNILFRIWLTGSDLNDPGAPNLGPDAVRNVALDVLEPHQALLVQVFEDEEAEAT